MSETNKDQPRTDAEARLQERDRVVTDGPAGLRRLADVLASVLKVPKASLSEDKSAKAG